MDRFGIYRTNRWRRLRKDKLAANPYCEYCPAGIITAAVEVDHRLSIGKGGDPWAWENLASSCHDCHSHKTMIVDTLGRAHTPRTVKGVDPRTGLPVDPNHWWRR
jgi:5-methylcytosine-specific restriction protein A